MKTAIALVSFLAVVQTAHAQTASDTLRALDSAWARAYATHDTVLAARIFDDSLFMTSGRGQLKTKSDEMGDVRPYPGMRVDYFRTRDVVVRTYGDAAVVAGLLDWSTTSNGRASPARRRYTAVWVRGGPLGWRMVALHIGPAPEG